jgi:catechol 2,3-dioxygenase-like lactoylglutathione lyase family enzyme
MEHIEPKVTGVGGVFFKSANQEALAKWYKDVLGMPMEEWHGMSFEWGKDTPEPGPGSTIFSVFPDKSTYYPGGFMINFRVQNLDGFIEKLKAAGARVEDVQKSEYGNFGWVYDPDGNKIELWEAPA